MKSIQLPSLSQSRSIRSNSQNNPSKAFVMRLQNIQMLKSVVRTLDNQKLNPHRKQKVILKKIQQSVREGCSQLYNQYQNNKSIILARTKHLQNKRSMNQQISFNQKTQRKFKQKLDKLETTIRSRQVQLIHLLKTSGVSNKDVKQLRSELQEKRSECERILEQAESKEWEYKTLSKMLQSQNCQLIFLENRSIYKKKYLKQIYKEIISKEQYLQKSKTDSRSLPTTQKQQQSTSKQLKLQNVDDKLVNQLETQLQQFVSRVALRSIVQLQKQVQLKKQIQERNQNEWRVKQSVKLKELQSEQQHKNKIKMQMKVIKNLQEYSQTRKLTGVSQIQIFINSKETVLRDRQRIMLFRQQLMKKKQMLVKQIAAIGSPFKVENVTKQKLISQQQIYDLISKQNNLRYQSDKITTILNKCYLLVQKIDSISNTQTSTDKNKLAKSLSQAAQRILSK